MLVISLIIATLFAILAWRDLRFALIVLAGLLPTYLIRFSIGPIPSTALELLILIAFAVWFVRKKAWKINYLSIGPYLRPLLLLLAAACFAVIVAQDTLSAFGIWKAYFLEPAMVFIMMRSVFEKQNDWTMTVQALAIAAIILSLFAILQAITGAGIPVPWDLERRVTSVFEYPNALGLFLAPIVAMSIVLIRTKKQRWFWILTAFLGLAAIIFAQTEAALIAIPAALVITFLFTTAKKQIKIAVLIGSVAFASLLIAVVPIVREKVLLQDYSGKVRISQWLETADLLQDHALFGVGLNQYPVALEPYHDATLYEIFQYPHNIFLNIWVELGLLGLIAFFWLAARTVKTVQLDRTNILKLAAFAALLTMAIHGLVDVPYFKNDLAVMTWILLALLSAPIATKKSA